MDLTFFKPLASAMAGFCLLFIALAGMLAVDPAYAAGTAEDKLATAHKLRDQGKFHRALKLLDTLEVPPNAGKTGKEISLFRSKVLVEAGEDEDAIQQIGKLLEVHPGAVDVNLAAAYIYRMANQPIEALATSLRVLSRDPENREAYQYQVYALGELGANKQALRLAEARPEFFHEEALIALRGDRAAQQVRWGQIETPDNPAKRFAVTDQALEMLDTLQSGLGDDTPGAILRTRRDRVLALRQAERYSEAIAAFEALEQDDPVILSYPYVLQAAADAYLADKHPEKATALYQRILADDPGNYQVQSALYYGLIESERFSEAIDLIDELAAQQPMFRSEHPYWNKLYLDSIAAMARAMTNRPDLAQKHIQSLLSDAPASALLRRDMAAVYRLRGWSDRALEEAEIAMAYEPILAESRLTYAQALFDSGRYREAEDGIEALYGTHPTDLHVQQLHDAWRDRKRWGLQTRAGYGDSDNQSRTLGSRDRSLETRLNAPWMNYNWRAYATHYYADARFEEGHAEYDRIGLGMEWQKRNHRAYASVSGNRTGSTGTGITAGYDAHLNDHWSFASRHETASTQTPLRAHNAGLDGEYSELAVRWQANESFDTRLGITRLAISDGNTRYAGLWSVNKRLFGSAHHVTEGRLNLYGSRASQSGGPYFNPERDASATLSIHHDWITWRRYARSFTQRFSLTGGSYWQRGFGTHSISEFGYQHEWKLSRRFSLRYGIGYSNGIYDGQRERRTHGQVALEVLF